MENNIINLKRKIKLLNDKNNKMYKEIKRLNNIIEKLEQENAVIKTLVVNKDSYTYGVR